MSFIEEVYITDAKGLLQKERIFLKLITNKSNDKVVGLHYLGENAAEIIQGFSVALVKGLKKRDFDKTVGIHPSSAEEIVTLKN